MEQASTIASESVAEYWVRVNSYLQSRLRPDLYQRWFAPLHPIALEGDRFRVAAPDKFHRDFIEDNYRSWFDEFIPNIVGRPLRVTFIVDEGSKGRADPPPPVV